MKRTILLLALSSLLVALFITTRRGLAESDLQLQAALQKATFAGGCFWCMEPPFDELPGVVSTTSGYTGGKKHQPTYEEVSAGVTGHTEAVEIAFDPGKITYAKLLQVFWKNIDPVSANRQFCDVGTQYRSAIFYHGEEQRRLALDSKEAIEKSGARETRTRPGRRRRGSGGTARS